MSGQGTNKHGPEQDEYLKHEAQPFTQGAPAPAHVEEFRQVDGFPDDTDDPEASQAANMTGDLVDTETVIDEAEDR